jgi:pantetheine-phosphate adenylyltransferase
MRGPALFPGSFDPFTLGHADIVKRALNLFDEVVIAVGYNENKVGWMPVEERLSTIRRLYADEPRVTVESYTGLTVDFAKKHGITAIIRGVRTTADFEYEVQLADVNRQLTGIETIFLPASPQFASLSSSIVRELAHFGRDISTFLP